MAELQSTASAERALITAMWGRSPQQCPRAELRLRDQRATPLKLKAMQSINQSINQH